MVKIILRFFNMFYCFRMDNSMMSTPGKSREVCNDMVAIFTHNTIPNYGQIQIREHPGEGRKRRVYSVDNTGTDKVKMIGTELEPSDERDYVIAIVNNTTGEIEYRPVKVCKFSTEHALDMDARLGEKRKDPVNFKDDHNMKGEDYMMKKNELTEAFGNTQKKRMLLNAQRRQIEESTMAEMNKTAFASATVIVGEKKEISVDDISMIKETQVSQILPTHVPKPDNAVLWEPSDFYPMHLFIDEEWIEEFGEICQTFFQSKFTDFDVDDTRKENPVPRVLKDYFGGRIKGRKTAVQMTCVGIMLYFLRCTKFGKLTNTHTKGCPFPGELSSRIKEKYLPGEMIRRGPVFSMDVGTGVYERLLAHTLTFYLTINNSNKMYTAWWASEQGVNKTVAKLEKILLAIGATKGTDKNAMSANKRDDETPSVPKLYMNIWHTLQHPPQPRSGGRRGAPRR